MHKQTSDDACDKDTETSLTFADNFKEILPQH